MLKIVVYCAALFTLSVVDIVIMKRQSLKKEMVPYVILAALAGFAAVFHFSGPHGESIIGALQTALRASGV